MGNFKVNNFDPIFNSLHFSNKVCIKLSEKHMDDIYMISADDQSDCRISASLLYIYIYI